MKETQFYHKALKLSLLDGKAAKAALDEQIAKEHKSARASASIPWRRVGMTTAAVLLLFFTTIMAIPTITTTSTIITTTNQL